MVILPLFGHIALMKRAAAKTGDRYERICFGIAISGWALCLICRCVFRTCVTVWV